jgi:hypothetical protein
VGFTALGGHEQPGSAVVFGTDTYVYRVTISHAEKVATDLQHYYILKTRSQVLGCSQAEMVDPRAAVHRAESLLC